MPPKYLVKPGKVVSQHDGDVHFISAEQLIALYGVDRRECIIDRGDMRGVDTTGLRVLAPSYSGNYDLRGD